MSKNIPNEPNFQKSQMFITTIQTMNYNKKLKMDTWSKRTQTKPIYGERSRTCPSTKPHKKTPRRILSPQGYKNLSPPTSLSRLTTLAGLIYHLVQLLGVGAHLCLSRYPHRHTKSAKFSGNIRLAGIKLVTATQILPRYVLPTLAQIIKAYLPVNLGRIRRHIKRLLITLQCILIQFLLLERQCKLQRRRRRNGCLLYILCRQQLCFGRIPAAAKHFHSCCLRLSVNRVKIQSGRILTLRPHPQPLGLIQLAELKVRLGITEFAVDSLLQFGLLLIRHRPLNPLWLLGVSVAAAEQK